MDEAIDTLNTAAALFSSAVLGYIVLDQRIREGAWVKAGLCVCILALLASAALTVQGAAGSPAWANVGLALRLGIALVCVGVLVRANRLGNARRARDPTRRRQAGTRGLLTVMTESGRDLGDMFRSDWAALDAGSEEHHRESQP